MTSLARESPLRIRLSTVRQQLLNGFVERFGFERLTVLRHGDTKCA
jgi:hypothetical protein